MPNPSPVLERATPATVDGGAPVARRILRAAPWLALAWSLVLGFLHVRRELPEPAPTCASTGGPVPGHPDPRLIAHEDFDEAHLFVEHLLRHGFIRGLSRCGNEGRVYFSRTRPELVRMARMQGWLVEKMCRDAYLDLFGPEHAGRDDTWLLGYDATGQMIDKRAGPAWRRQLMAPPKRVEECTRIAFQGSLPGLRRGVVEAVDECPAGPP
jgi:hypothetical protein